MKASDTAPPKVINFGCRLNLAESAQIQDHLDQTKLNNVIVVNSCAVTNEAVRKTKQAIRRAKQQHPGHQIIATGCAAQVDPKTFLNMPEVDEVLDNQSKMQRSTYEKFEHPEEKDFTFILASQFEAHENLAVTRDRHARAHLEIQNGCDHRCTFCIIPFGRGDSRSVPAGVIVNKARELVAEGIHEIVLTGVDLTSWGSDLPGDQKLGDLCRRLLKLVPDLPYLRLSSLDVAEIDPVLEELLIHEPRICPFVHLSLQHGDNLILKRMKRRHQREDAIAFTSRLKDGRPELTFGADLIAGFPTESEEQFNRSCTIIDECDITFSHIFPFSPKKGTPAALMPQVAGPKIKQRAKILRELAKTKLKKHLTNYPRIRKKAIVEKNNLARLADYTQMSITNAINVPPGALVDVEISGNDKTTLLGIIVQ